MKWVSWVVGRLSTSIETMDSLGGTGVCRFGRLVVVVILSVSRQTSAERRIFLE
jgi:hypothetical protein